MDSIDSSVLWMLEKTPAIKGGCFKCKSDSIRLRHLNTGKYLAIRQVGGPGIDLDLNEDEEEDHEQEQDQLNENGDITILATTRSGVGN